MHSRLKTYSPLLLSLALGGVIVLLVLRIVSFSDAVTSYYTPAILNFENLMEGSQHLKAVMGDSGSHDPSESIAARHFTIALDRLIRMGNTTWPGDHQRPLDEVLAENHSIAVIPLLSPPAWIRSCPFSPNTP